MSSTLMIAVLCCLIVIIAMMLIYHVHRAWRAARLERLYQRDLGHPPDPVSLDRWLHGWSGQESEWGQFVARVRESQMRCMEERVVFVGLCQDHARESLAFWVPIVERLGRGFKDYRVLFLENDSRDDSREVLLAASRRNPRFLVLCDDETPMNADQCVLGIRAIDQSEDKETRLASRLETMAYLRDTYMRRISRKWPDYDYMVVVDWDLVGQLPDDGFYHALSLLRDQIADGVMVNSLHPTSTGAWKMFDTFPLLQEDIQCERVLHHKREMDEMTKEQYSDRLWYQLRHPLHIRSAFGGIGIYRLATVLSTRSHYHLAQEDKVCPIQCEHTAMHRFLRICIDPWFVFLLEKNLH